MIDYASDMLIILADHGEPVTFWDSGYRVDTTAVVAVSEPTASMFDGSTIKAETRLTVLAADVTGITAGWRVDVRGNRRKVLDVNRSDPTTFSLLLSDPED